MATVEESIDIDMPIDSVYNQWTQFEDFPMFMEGVEEVRQVTDTKLHWRATIAGQTREWDAEIFEQVPEQRIAWRSIDGVVNAGAVTFHAVNDRKTRVMLQIEFEPESFLEKVGDTLGFVRNRVQGDLERFRSFIQEREMETGSWRGEIQGGEVVKLDEPETKISLEDDGRTEHSSFPVEQYPRHQTPGR